MVHGNPALAYYNSCGDVNALEYLRSRSSTGTGANDWLQSMIVQIDGWCAMCGLSMAIVDGSPAISYWSLSEKGLKYARSTSEYGNNLADWEIITLTGGYDVSGMRSSLVVFAGCPIISSRCTCTASSRYDIVLTSATTSTGSDPADWNAPDVVDSMTFTEATPTATSLAIVDGSPAISYRDINTFDLKYAFYVP